MSLCARSMLSSPRIRSNFFFLKSLLNYYYHPRTGAVRNGAAGGEFGPSDVFVRKLRAVVLRCQDRTGQRDPGGFMEETCERRGFFLRF